MRSLMRLVSRVASLSSRDLLLLIRITASLWVARIALWIMPFSTFYRFLDTRYAESTERNGLVRDSDRTPEKIGSLVSGGSRIVPYATCLVRASVAYVYLRRAGYPADLKIGVRRSVSDEFLAHAWVVSDGLDVIGGIEAQDFVSFPLNTRHVA